MNEKGICEIHGEFILADGCPGCLREEARKSEAVEAIWKPSTQSEMTATSTPEISMVEPVPTAIVRVKPEQDALVQSFYDQAKGLKDYAEKLTIITPEDLKKANNDIAQISKLKKALEEKKREYLSPLREFADAIRETFSTFFDPIIAADKITRDKMLAFDAEQKRIRREQEEVNRLRMEAAQKEMDLKGKLTEAVNLVEVMPEAPKRVSTDMGTSGVATNWKFKVIDFSLLPDRFKMENTALIGRIVRAGEREIPGVKIWPEDSLRMKLR